MHLHARPTLRFPVNIDQERQHLILSTDTEYIQFDGIPPAAMANLVERLDGSSTVAELAKSLYINEERALAFLSVLNDRHLILGEEPRVYTGEQIARLLSTFYVDWNDGLFAGPLWSALVNGTAPPRVVDGWLIESYHFIRGANARLAYAAAHANDQRIRRIFAKHYVEEYDHHNYFAESLRRRKIEPDAVDRVGPLPTTLAVINAARRAARLDCLCYAACSGLLESTGSDAVRARSFYAAVAEHYDRDDSNFVEPMLKHIDLDEGFEHGSVMRDVFNPIGVLSSARANQIVETAILFKETLQLWFGDIERFYFRGGAFDNGLVRRPYRPAVQHKE